MMQDIRTTEDIKLLVDVFYERIKSNALLAPVFAKRISDQTWPVHLEKMYRFWGSILLYTQNYNGSPFDKHIGLEIGNEHFTAWLTLFAATVDELFEGETANLAKERANNIGRIFEFKLSTL
ncbi:MAG: group III truncated hemoglobin [Bacteroidota bacterium]